MRTVRKRFQLASDAESSIRLEAQTDQAFILGDQWEAKAKQIRDDDNRPCLTINRIPQFIHQVTNEQRQQRPSLTVKPEGGAEAINTETLRLYADIWQGLIRHIEVRSDAETAYDTAFEDQVGISFGWWRLITEYAGTDTFDQEILIKRVLDPFSVYIDPSANEPDRSDMKWAFITSRMSRDEFKRQFKDADMGESGFFSDFDGGPGPEWLTDDDIQIAEYYEIEFERRQLQSLRAPQSAIDELVAVFGQDKVGKPDGDGNIEITVYQDEYKAELLPAGTEVVNERPVDVPAVKWYKVSGYDILDETDWEGKWIPLVPCYGDESISKGKKQIISLTRFIRDSQVLYNFFRSAQAEVIALTPKAPFIGPMGSFKSHYRMWQKANNTNYSFLEYDPVILPNGQVAPPPQRNIAEPPIQAITEAAREADYDLKAGTGIYQSALGEKSNETSGRAIIARQRESDTSNFHFVDNFHRAMRHTGRILMDLIPHIYDRKERIIRIVKPDNTEEMVMINGDTTYNGKPVFFDPNVGRYDVNVSTEPGFALKMEQTWELLVALAQANPQVMAVAPDLMMLAAPLPGNLGTQMADRFKATLPPAVAQVANGNKPADPQSQAQLMQAAQMIEVLNQKVQELSETLRTKKLELESKERIALWTQQTNLIMAELKAGSENANQLATLDFQSIQHRLDLVHQSISMDAEMDQRQVEMQHEKDLAKQQAAAKPQAA